MRTWTREWHGSTFTVVEDPEGTFTMGGRSFASLTACAKAATGAASISGPKFFSTKAAPRGRVVQVETTLEIPAPLKPPSPATFACGRCGDTTPWAKRCVAPASRRKAEGEQWCPRCLTAYHVDLLREVDELADPTSGVRRMVYEGEEPRPAVRRKNGGQG